MTPRRTELDDVEVRSENRKGAAGAAVRPPGPGRVTRVRCPPRTTAGVCPGGTARCSGHPGVRGRTPRRWRCAPCASCAATRAADSHPGRKYSRERNTAARTLNAIGEISRSVTEEMRHRSRDPRNGGSSRAGRHAESGWPCHPPRAGARSAWSGRSRRGPGLRREGTILEAGHCNRSHYGAARNRPAGGDSAVPLAPRATRHGPPLQARAGQLLRPMPPHRAAGLLASSSDRGRQSGTGTIPGSTMSRSAKKRAT